MKFLRNSGITFSQEWLFNDFRNNVAKTEVKMARYVQRTFADKTQIGPTRAIKELAVISLIDMGEGQCRSGQNLVCCFSN